MTLCNYPNVRLTLIRIWQMPENKKLRLNFQGSVLCMESRTHVSNNIYMSQCNEYSSNQSFYYDPGVSTVIILLFVGCICHSHLTCFVAFSYAESHRIKHGKNLCVDYDFSSRFYLSGCHDGSNQKWYYNKQTKALKTFYTDVKCLDMATDKLLQMSSGCNNESSQKFDVSVDWLPYILVSGDIETASDSLVRQVVI